MMSRISEGFASSADRFLPLRSASLLALVACLFWAAEANALSPEAEQTLRAGHSALEEGEFARALELLERVPGDDSRVLYYRAYALEKLNRCAAARASYEAVAATQTQMALYAERALEGFSGRCSPIVAHEAPRGSGRAGWKIAGWTTLVLGALTLLTVPAKASVEQGASGEAEEYFRLRYGCDVDGDQISGDTCKKGELREDDGWTEYRDRTRAAARTNRALLFAGGTAAGLGLATVLTVALTRPSAVSLTAWPTSGGANVGVVVRF